MTRVNASIPPEELYDQHLMAEYREIPMVPAALRRSLRTASEKEILKRIPKSFSLNKGHVTFFYDKLKYLRIRYCDIVSELQKRGFRLDPDRNPNFENLPVIFYGDYIENDIDANIVRERIALRVSDKPDWYRKTNY